VHHRKESLQCVVCTSVLTSTKCSTDQELALARRFLFTHQVASVFARDDVMAAILKL